MTLKFSVLHWVCEYYQICSNDDPGLTLTYFTARSNLVPYTFVWEKVKTIEFLETIVACDIHVGRCIQLNVYMKIFQYQRSRSFIDLCPNHSDSILLNFFSSITADFNILSTEVSDTNLWCIWYMFRMMTEAAPELQYHPQPGTWPSGQGHGLRMFMLKFSIHDSFCVVLDGFDSCLVWW